MFIYTNLNEYFQLFSAYLRHLCHAVQSQSINLICPYYIENISESTLNSTQRKRFFILTDQQTFMTESKSALLSSFDVCHPQVVIIYEGNETGITRRDLGVHANP